MPTAATERLGAGLTTVDGRTFSLVRARLQTRAEGGMAWSTLIQDYRNPHEEPLEVVYTMPLPADGSVLGYTVTLGKRVVRGKIEAREEAREQYYEALERGHTAGLLEQERADTFTQTLGNLPPGDQVRVRIEVLQPLAFERGEGGRAPGWVYRFPTVIGVRYQGAEGRVPDSAKLDAPRADDGGTPVRLELGMVIADGVPGATEPRSTSHPLSITERSKATHVTTARTARLDRDLVVTWNAASEAVRASLVEGRGLDGDDGRYALLTITPPVVPERTFPRDLTLLLDASGSMRGAPIQRAKQVARELILSLAEGDRFELTAFALSPRSLTRGPVEASNRKQVEAALEELASLQAGGGTEMRRAIVDALHPLRPTSQRQVVLLTDGYIGFEQEVIGQVLGQLPAEARVHAVGVGSAPNRTLTSGVARAGRGVEILVGDDSDAAESAKKLRRGTARPVLTNLVVRGTAPMGAAPERPRDVFAGQPLVVALELDRAGGFVEVSASLAGRAEPWTQRFEVAAIGHDANARTLPLGALYGRERVADLEMKTAAASPDLEQGRDREEIRVLGLRHRIVTRETSLIAISEDPTVDPTDPRRRERLAVELPHGVSAEGVGLLAPRYLKIGTTVVPMSLLRRKALRKMRTAMPPKASPAGAPAMATNRIVRRTANSLVIEFESPGKLLAVPGKADLVTVECATGGEFDARVDASTSARAGVHRRGVTIRLVLRPTSWIRSIFRRSARRGPRRLRWTIDGRRYEVDVRAGSDEGI